ncbi:MAG: transcription factor [Candidatus Nezhaarchaeota archaeon]|nr:transcription factor [Candidatus Nezhaarchaeota archaeon]
MAEDEKDRDEVMLSIIAQIAGPDAIKVTYALINEGWLTDEAIASKTLLRINQVRKILYSLLNNQLVTYKKIRDEASGWYTYYWMLNKEGVEGLVLLKKRQVFRKLQERLEFEKDRDLYRCPQCENSLLSFDEAFETYFRCPNCGQQLENYDNSKIIKVLEAKISRLKEELCDYSR